MQPETQQHEHEIEACIAQLGTECKEVYRACETLAGHSCRLMEQQHLQKAGSIMLKLWRIYSKARNRQVKTAIENVYLYKVGDTIFSSRRREDLMALLPRTFRNLLLQQMSTFGI